MSMGCKPILSVSVSVSVNASHHSVQTAHIAEGNVHMYQAAFVKASQWGRRHVYGGALSLACISSENAMLGVSIYDYGLNKITDV